MISILKRGIHYPASIQNYRGIHSEQLASSLSYYYQSQPSLSLIMDAERSILTLVSTPEDPLPKNTSIPSEPSWTLAQNSRLTTQMHLMSEHWQSLTSVLQYSHDIPCRSFQSRQNTSSSQITITGQTFHLRQKRLRNSLSLFPCPTCATNLTDFSALPFLEALNSISRIS